MANQFSKTASVEKPYAVFRKGSWEWRVLKTYKLPKNENGDKYARWFCAVKSEFTYGSFEMGDTYIRDILGTGAVLALMTPEFKAAYGPWMLSLGDPAELHDALEEIFG